MARARILAVDHQLYFRVFLDELLSEEGYAVETAADAEEALARLARGSFDLVLVDLAVTGAEGAALVSRLKARAPEADVVVLTSVADAKVAAEAIKLGATEYLLKPVDRAVLARALASLVQQRQMREEHASLLAENMEFMGAVSLYERALSLYAASGLEALADRIVESLCLETHAHGGVLWLARADDPERLRLLGARGLVRVADEPEEWELERLPAALAALAEPQQGALVPPTAEGERGALWVPLRQRGVLLGLARLTDKLDGGEFDDFDRGAAQKLASFAAQAVANALELRALERRSFRDPTTRAYTRAYFEDAAHNELRKAARFGRTLSAVRVELDGVPALRERLSELEMGHWLETVALAISRCLRSADLLAVEAEGRFCALLPETDALGAAVLRQRLRETLEQGEALLSLPESDRPAVLLASATVPADGSDLGTLLRNLDARTAEDRLSPLRDLELRDESYAALAEALLADAEPGTEQRLEQITRFLLGEVARRPHERGLLFLASAPGLRPVLREGFEALRGRPLATEIVWVGADAEPESKGLPITRATPQQPIAAPLLIWCGEGAPYALLGEPDAGERPSLYHTSDRSLVEQLAFRLGRDLGIPIGREAGAPAIGLGTGAAGEGAA